MKFKLNLCDVLSPDIEELVTQGHIRDEATHGIVCDYKKFVITIQNPQHDIVGTLMAYTAFSEIYVDDIWVHPDYRGQTLGRQLLASLENRFKGRGYNNMNLVINAFQTPDFYKKMWFYTRIYT